MSDAYDHIFEGFSFDTELIFSGRHFDIDEFGEYPTGFAHFIKEGNANIEIKGMKTIQIRQPSLIFFPKPHLQRILPIDENGVVMVCVHIGFNVSFNHPLIMSFPDVLVIELDKFHPIKAILEVFIDEALSVNIHKKQAAEKLSALILIHMTRYAIEHQLVHSRLISALSNQKIADALEIIHTHFNTKLTLDSVAKEIGISRSQFAVLFTRILEQTFLDYLSSHRIRIAQKLLQANKSVKVVASEVGFSNSSAFIRKFKEVTGMPPGKWQSVN